MPISSLLNAPRLPQPRRSLSDKLADIAIRSPKDHAAVVVMVDFILARLDATHMFRLP